MIIQGKQAVHLVKGIFALTIDNYQLSSGHTTSWPIWERYQKSSGLCAMKNTAST